MTIRVGTLQEMTGQGLEILVDQATRSMVLARFFEGTLVSEAASESARSGSLVSSLPPSTEPTLVALAS